MNRTTIAAIMIALAVSSELSARFTRNERRLRAAIEALDCGEVKNLLKEGVLTKENSTKFLDQALHTRDYYEDNRSLFTAKKDTVCFFSGLMVTALGIVVAVQKKSDYRGEYLIVDDFNEIEVERKRQPLPGLALGALGLYLAGRGYKGTERASYLKRAESIVDLIKEKSESFAS